MRKGGNIRRHILTAFIFIALEAGAIAMMSHSDEIHRQWAMRGVIASRAAIFGTIEGIGDYFGLRKLNDSLARANSELNELLSYYRETLRRAEWNVDSASFPGFRLIPAEIVKGSVNKQRNFLILDKGSDDGISPNMGVITDKAVVGVVDAVTAHYSYVISFMSPDINISARLAHSGITGTLRWDGKGSRHAILGQIPLHTEIPEGDTVYTSGFSNLYPPDIPVGTVTSTEIVDGASLNVEIRLLQEFRGLRYVSIVNNTGKAEIDSLTL